MLKSVAIAAFVPFLSLGSASQKEIDLTAAVCAFGPDIGPKLAQSFTLPVRQKQLQAGDVDSLSFENGTEFSVSSSGCTTRVSGYSTPIDDDVAFWQGEVYYVLIRIGPRTYVAASATALPDLHAKSGWHI